MALGIINQDDVILSGGTASVTLAGGTASVTLAGGAANVTLLSGTADIGYVGSYGATPFQTPTVTSGTAYASGENVGGLLTFPNAARTSGGGGVIIDFVIVDNSGQDPELELWLFAETFTAGADKAAWAGGTADLQNCIGVLSTAQSSEGYIAAGTPSICTTQGLAKRYDVTATSMFGRLVNRTTTPTFTATDNISVKVGLLQD